MKIDFYASRPNYIDHLAPIWHKGGAIRDRFGVANQRLAEYAAEQDISAEVIEPKRLANPTVVAGYRDTRRLRNQIIYLEHGVGQSYGDQHPAYSGGTGRGHIGLLLVPNERSKGEHPNAKVVGMPKLDEVFQRAIVKMNYPSIVCVSFHWRCRISPYAGTLFDYYKSGVLELAEHYDKTILHAHPLIADEVERWAKETEIEFEPSFRSVLDRADVYCVDNSSTLWEFAATGKPSLALGHPMWQAAPQLWPRFNCDMLPGLEITNPADLVDAVSWSIENYRDLQIAALRPLANVFTYLDGSSTERALSAIISYLENREV